MPYKALLEQWSPSVLSIPDGVREDAQLYLTIALNCVEDERVETTEPRTDSVLP
jgi:hypothetical protein